MQQISLLAAQKSDKKLLLHRALWAPQTSWWSAWCSRTQDRVPALRRWRKCSRSLCVFFRSLKDAAVQTIPQVDFFAMSGADCVLSVVPMFHVMSWGLPFGTLMLGCKTCLNNRFMRPSTPPYPLPSFLVKPAFSGDRTRTESG